MLEKRLYLKVFFLISQPKHMLWALKILFVRFESLRPSQLFFSDVGTGLPGFNQH